MSWQVGGDRTRGLLGKSGMTLAIFLAGDALIFAFGVAWLTASFGWTKAIAVGVTPFLLGEAIKIALATAIAQLWLGRAQYRT